MVSTSVGFGRLVGSSENGGYQSGGGRDYSELDFGDRLGSGSIAVTRCCPVTNSVEIQKISQARESRRGNGGFRTTVSGCGTGRARRSFSCGCNEAGQVQGWTPNFAYLPPAYSGKFVHTIYLRPCGQMSRCHSLYVHVYQVAGATRYQGSSRLTFSILSAALYASKQIINAIAPSTPLVPHLPASVRPCPVGESVLRTASTQLVGPLERRLL